MATGDILSEEIIRGGKDGIDHVWVKKLFLRNGSAVFNKRYVQGKIVSADYWAERERDLLMVLYLKHVPNVVQTATWRGDQDGHLLELETIDAGPTIDDWLRTPAQWRLDDKHSSYCPFVAVDEFFKLLRGCLATLRGIHIKGFVHCDIKADNIALPFRSAEKKMIELDYAKITLIDFGYSIVNDPNNPLKRVVPTDYEKADYLSDPQRRALQYDWQKHEPKKYQQLDYSCDLYSLGRMAYRISEKLTKSAGGVKPMGMLITSNDLKKIINSLLQFKKGIPRKWKKKETGVVHDLLIQEIDDCLQRIQSSNFIASSPFIRQEIRNREKDNFTPANSLKNTGTTEKTHTKTPNWITPFLRRLDGKPWYKKPQEIAAWLAIITFFTTGAPWIYTHFVTKTGGDLKPPVVVAPPTP